MLWIALHLPLLSLESFTATLAAGGGGDSAAAAAQPIALMDAHRIVSANETARSLGVCAGLKRATALALAPQLTLGRADARRDACALEPVAHAALAFTPSVVLQPPESPEAAAHTVLLEVEASLRYFGGLERLLQRLHAVLRPLHHVLHTVSAPTAQGAALLARLHRELRCPDLEATHRAFDAAPVWLLGPGREHWETLQGMGLRTVGELRCMPRAGLARRFGEALLADLDRALGTLPDPREPIALPPVFDSRLELFARADTTEQVLHGAGVLLERLVLWLAAQHAGVRRFTLAMDHEARRVAGSDGPRSTVLEIALAEPSRDAAHLLVLLRERLGRLQLPAPTLDLGLHADDIVRRAAPNQELFPTSASTREGLTQLIERLQARLGPEQVQRLQRVADHRPECAGRIEALGAGSASSTSTSTASASGAGMPRSAPGRSAATRRQVATSGAATSRPAASKPRRAPSGRPLAGAASVPVQPAAATPWDKPAEPVAAAQPVAAGLRAEPAARVLPAAASSCPLPPSRPASRPVWLLQDPEPLPERQSRPLLGGEPLQLLSGPERIEAGWWDSALAERDYFIAQDARGALVWIYRARLPLSAGEGKEGWFMQGRFG